MAHRIWVVAASVIVAAAPLSAANPNLPGPSAMDSPSTRYCLKVAAPTGSLIERVMCWTRAEWWDQGVDVDKEWPKEGVAIRS